MKQKQQQTESVLLWFCKVCIIKMMSNISFFPELLESERPGGFFIKVQEISYN